MPMKSWVAALIALAMCACGGGGGDDGASPTSRAPLPSLSQDINPTGMRLDYRARNYFPAAVGDTWTYAELRNGTVTGPTATRAVAPGVGGDVVISETSFGSTDSTTYRRTADGLVEVLPLAGSVPDLVSQFVGNLLEYPEPFYAVGQTRTILRQGNWGADLDGDGINDSYRLEITQKLLGFETVTLPNATSAEAAHFRNVTSLTLQPSVLKNQPLTRTVTEDAWWAPGIGLVRADRTAADSSSSTPQPTYSIVLTGGQVAGVSLLTPPIDGTLFKVALTHNALVFDRQRGRYYASVPGSVAVNGNRIAIVEPATGAVSYSAAVGSEPFALALSPDGFALYVGLNGSGDVVKLRLPDMVEQWRARLPNVTFFGQLFAETMSVSPLDPDAVAVSMFYANLSPRHGGVVLVRAGVVQPAMTQTHTGSNLIAFDGSGQYVYGFNNETSEFGLRRIAVTPTGLVQEQVVTAALANSTARSLHWSANGLVLDRAVYRAPDLALLGQIDVVAGGCTPLPVPNRLVCSDSPLFGTDQVLAVVDATTFTIQSRPIVQRGINSDSLTQIVSGPVGQVALRMNATYYNSSANALWLFTSPTLQ